MWAKQCRSDMLKELQQVLRECCSQMTECRRELEALSSGSSHAGIVGAPCGNSFDPRRGSDVHRAGDNPPIVSRILYALPAWGCFLSKKLSGRINAFLKQCYRYGLRPKLNVLTSYSIGLVWTCFTKYVALNIVCMIFCLL